MGEHQEQKPEVVVMLVNLDKKEKKIQKLLENLSGPEEIFNVKTINFFKYISKNILKNKKSLKFPDLITFAFCVVNQT